MKTAEQIERALRNVPTEGTEYAGMTYEQGVEEALQWVLGEISDDEFEYSNR